MSERSAKAERRNLRRLVGTAASTTFDAHQEAIQSLGLTLNKVRGDVADLARDYAISKREQSKRLDALDVKVFALESFPSTFWGRLRWLLTGK